MEDKEEKQPLGRLARAGVGRLFLVLAGFGTLVLVIFVLMPMLTEAPPPPPPPSPEEIVAEVMGTSPETASPEAEEQAVEEPPDAPAPSQGAAVDGEGMPAPTVPSPLLAVRNNGEELPVVFPQLEPQGEQEGPAPDGLPPPLSPEEIEAALPEAAPAAEPLSEADGGPGQETPGSAASEVLVRAATGTHETPQARTEGPSAEAPAPSVFERPIGAAPADVREVQGLLEKLGFDPGPVDGVWGSRTTEAWKAFAREAGVLALAVATVGKLSEGLSPEEVQELNELEAQWEEEQASGHSETRPPVEAASPSEEVSREVAAGAVRAGNQQPGPPAETVVVGKTLRGVMGYRMPLVSRQTVPDQVVSGVLIPSHTTFVILRPGFWELTGLSPEDVGLLRDAQARAEAASEAAVLAAQPEAQPVKRGWNPLRLFRRQGPRGEQ